MGAGEADHGGRQEARRSYPKNSTTRHNAERHRPDYWSARLRNDEVGGCNPRKRDEHQGQQAVECPAERGSDPQGMVPNPKADEDRSEQAHDRVLGKDLPSKKKEYVAYGDKEWDDLSREKNLSDETVKNIVIEVE